MKLLSLNVGRPRTVLHQGKSVTTGIFKDPQSGRVRLGRLNLEGDGQADLQAHGGEHKAVYAYPHENYAHWARVLGRDDFVPGQFGENFTTEGLGDDEVHIGDIFRLGGAVVQVTQPRVPCFKLDLRMATAGFAKPFLKSGRVGFYLRVVEEGEVGAGDALDRVELGAGSMSVREVSNLLYFDKDNVDDTRRVLAIPALAPGWRTSFEQRLAKHGAGKKLGI